MTDAGRSITQVLTATIRQHIDTDANASLVLKETVEEVLERAEDHTLADKLPGLPELRRAYVERLVKSQLKGTSDRVKGSLLEGSTTTALDLGDDYDMSFTVCGRHGLQVMYDRPFTAGRVTLLGSVTATDMDLMRLEAETNLRKQQAAYDAMDPRLLTAAANLRPYRDYKSYRRAAEAVA